MWDSRAKNMSVLYQQYSAATSACKLKFEIS